MQSKQRVRRLANFLYYGTLAVMVFIVIVTCTLVFQPLTVDVVRQAHPDFAISDQITQPFMITSVVLGLIPFFIWVWTLNQMRLLFGAYKNGEVLTDRSAWRIQQIGFGLMGVALSDLLLIPVQSLVLTWSNPEGERALSVGLSSDMLGMFIAAGLMTVIGWAMREASALAAENEAFI